MRVTGYNSLIREVIADALKGYHADYLEADLEERQDTSMIYSGARLEETGRGGIPVATLCWDIGLRILSQGRV